MIYSEHDIIVAPATPSQLRAPLGILRVSGPGCWQLLETAFKPVGTGQPQSWRARYGQWCDSKGTIDDVVVLHYAQGNSYTGQEMFEVICHGNPLFVDLIQQHLVFLGARLARPGEFTQRAFLSGRIDLLQAEAVQDMIEAKTRYQADLVRRQVSGPLVATIRNQVEAILAIQAHIEATIDYGEEDVDALDRPQLAHKLAGIVDELRQLHRTAGFVLGMKRGFRVLLTGPPNAGKSTLFNALIEKERAIVSERPGTTRDLVTEEVSLRGLPVVFVDSAGVRQSDDEVEQLGIQKIRDLIGEVDLVLVLHDASDELFDDSTLHVAPQLRLDVAAKADLGVNPKHPHAISAKTGQGLAQLKDQIVLRLSAPVANQHVYLTNRRQEDVLKQTVQLLGQALREFQAGFGEEILSSHLNQARRLLGELTGETTVEDILDRMFSNFCLGK